MNPPKDKKAFLEDLFTFLRKRTNQALKIPYIGAKELDLHALYLSVTKRGGAENVSNHKLWKEIVAEFSLPSSCTSASFTLKNHYQKYLLEYEQKYFFNKSDQEIIKELSNQRHKRTRTTDFQGNQVQLQSFPDGGLERQGNNYSLQETLVNAYSNKRSEDQLCFVKKKRLVPYSSEIKRIVLAFECKSALETRFALNSLLLYSCSRQTPFYFENYRVIFNEFCQFFHFLVHQLSSSQFFLGHLSCHPEEQTKKSKSSTAENEERPALQGNDGLLNVIPSSLSYSSEMLLSSVSLDVERLPSSEQLEQLKIVLTIFRNCLQNKSNEALVAKDFQLVDAFYQCLLTNNDNEVNRLCLEIFAILACHILIKDTPHSKEHMLLAKILECLNSDADYEIGVEGLHNLMLNQENEGILEA